MPWWAVLWLALLVAPGGAAAQEGAGSRATSLPPFSAVVLQETTLRDAAGNALAQVGPYAVLPLLARQGDALVVAWPAGPKRGEARLAAGAAAVVLGTPAEHRRRLARIRQANLAPELKRRLMAGRIAEGDNLWLVEMAWGRPQRSFMVNYFFDEQHFVYLLPGSRPVLLRFVGGSLKGPLPAATRAAAAQLESPPTPR